MTDTAVMVHGDDFVAVGTSAGLKKTSEALENMYRLKVQILRSRKDCDQEIRVLNKIIRYTASVIEMEADPKHPEIVACEPRFEGATAQASVRPQRRGRRRGHTKGF